MEALASASPGRSNSGQCVTLPRSRLTLPRAGPVAYASWTCAQTKPRTAGEASSDMRKLISHFAATLSLLGAAACGAGSRADSSQAGDGSVGESAGGAGSDSDRRPEPTWMPKSCFEMDGGCWEDLSAEGTAHLEELCRSAGATVYWNDCSYISQRAIVGCCEDPERQIRRIVYFEEGVSFSCASGLLASPEAAIQERTAACQLAIDALGPPPPPTCSGPSLRTHLEACVDRTAKVSAACATCMLAHTEWRGGFVDSVVHCTDLLLGNWLYDCPDTCPEG